MELLCRPLENWPREFTAERQRRNPFRTNFEKTRRKLLQELGKLEAHTVVVQIAFPEREISPVTGWPRADRSPEHPGVIVNADTKHGALKWVCDAFEEWTANVHAIALTLDRLRRAELYGVTRKGEQYIGWRLLPGPITAAATTMSIEAAARFVSQHADVGADRLIKSRAAWEKAYRTASRKLHPDAGGAQNDWKQLQDASQLLNGLHSRK